MIAKQIKGKDFYGVLAYNEKKLAQGVGQVIDSNIEYGRTIDMTNEFNSVRELRPRLRKAVYHVSLNLPYDDKLSDKEFALLAMDYLKGMGFDNNQYITYRHTDQDHEHIHIIANRVKFSGDLISDSKDYERSERLVRKLEKKYGLTALGNVKLVKKAALTQKEIEKTSRTGRPPIKLMLQQSLDNTMTKSSNTSQFINELKQGNIHPKFNVSKTTGRVSGVSFRYQDVIYKGSTLGRQYSWNNIIKRIDYEQDRDSSIILENGSPERRAEGITVENIKGARSVARKTKDAQTGAIKINRQSKNNLGNTQTDKLSERFEDEILWSPFRLELEDKKRRKKRKGRRL